MFLIIEFLKKYSEGLLDPYSLIISFGKTSQVEGNVYSCFSLNEKVIVLVLYTLTCRWMYLRN